ncbi:MAG: hypothetical protein K5894_14595, partial [Lachnospiraceae bacterium]|nr:hypothetical protein [Lachnospiraceae bacterium]
VFEGMTHTIKGRIKDRLRIKNDDWLLVILQRFKVFVLVDFAWIFFKASSFRVAIDYIRRMFFVNLLPIVDGSILNYGLDLFGLTVVFISLIVFYIGQSFRRRGRAYTLVCAAHPIFQWIGYMIAVLCVVCLGIYGSGGATISFNYFMF